MHCGNCHSGYFLPKVTLALYNVTMSQFCANINTLQHLSLMQC